MNPRQSSYRLSSDHIGRCQRHCFRGCIILVPDFCEQSCAFRNLGLTLVQMKSFKFQLINQLKILQAPHFFPLLSRASWFYHHNDRQNGLRYSFSQFQRVCDQFGLSIFKCHAFLRLCEYFSLMFFDSITMSESFYDRFGIKIIEL